MTEKHRAALRYLWDAQRDAPGTFTRMPSQAMATSLAPSCRGFRPQVDRAHDATGATVYRLTADGRLVCARLFGR